jgi:hypothetical protein
MKKSTKAIMAVAAASIGAFVGAAVWYKKRPITLNVTVLEKAVLDKYPNAIITGIENSNSSTNIYVVTVILGEKEYKIFATAKGEIISSNPNIPEEFESEGEEK